VLDGLGLTSEQEAVYVVLIDVPSATLEEISRRCPGVPAGPVIADLEQAGLVSRLADAPGSSSVVPVRTAGSSPR
jgi:sugar-specific transcriptional regulator TrmB